MALGLTSGHDRSFHVDCRDIGVGLLQKRKRPGHMRDRVTRAIEMRVRSLAKRKR